MWCLFVLFAFRRNMRVHVSACVKFILYFSLKERALLKRIIVILYTLYIIFRRHFTYIIKAPLWRLFLGRIWSFSSICLQYYFIMMIRSSIMKCDARVMPIPLSIWYIPLVTVSNDAYYQGCHTVYFDPPFSILYY